MVFCVNQGWHMVLVNAFNWLYACTDCKHLSEVKSTINVYFPPKPMLMFFGCQHIMIEFNSMWVLK